LCLVLQGQGKELAHLSDIELINELVLKK